MDLKVFCCIVAVRKYYDWHGYVNYVFAKTVDDAVRFIKAKYEQYPEINIRSIKEREIKEGLFLNEKQN